MGTTTRAMAKVQISFGLVVVPVRVLKATDPRTGTGMHQYHEDDLGRMRQKLQCEACSTELTRAEVARGVEDGGQVVLVTADDMADLPLATTKSIEVLQFTDPSQISPLMFNDSYYLEPDGDVAVQAYALLLAAMVKEGKIGICKVALREGKEQLGALRMENGVLVMTTLLWPEEVRRVHFDALDKAQVATPMLRMARDLITSMVGDFDPNQFTDEYAAAFAAMISSKKSGVKPTPQPKKQNTATTSLAEALKASIAVKTTTKSSRRKAS